MKAKETKDNAQESGRVEGEYEAILERFRDADRHIRELRLHNRILGFGILGAVALAGAAWMKPAPDQLDSETVEAKRIVLLGGRTASRAASGPWTTMGARASSCSTSSRGSGSPSRYVAKDTPACPCPARRESAGSPSGSFPTERRASCSRTAPACLGP